MVDNGADYHKKGLIRNDSYVYGNLMGIASAKDRVDILKYFVEDLGIDVHDKELTDFVSEDGWDAAGYSIILGQIESTEYLIKHNADIFGKVEYNGVVNNKYNYCIKNDNIELFKLLWDNGLKDSIEHKSLMVNAIDYNAFNTCEFLINQGVSVKVKKDDGDIFRNLVYNDSLFQLLIDNGYDAKSRGKNDWTYLFEAAQKGKIEVVKMLINIGVNNNFKNMEGKSALDLAAGNFHKQLVSYFLSLGCQSNDIMSYIKTGFENEAIELLNKQHYEQKYLDSILHICYNFSLWKLMEELIRKGADINSPDKNGNLIIHKLILLEDIVRIKALVAMGADVNAKDLEGNTALTLTKLNKNKEIEEYLILNGADISYRKSNKIRPLLQSGHHNAVSSLSYSPDGRYFISGSWDYTIKLWDIESGKEIRTFSGHSSGVYSLSYSPNGKYFISGSMDNTIKLWEIESGKEIRTFSGHSSWVYSLSYSPDGKYFISGSGDKTIKLWDIESGKEIRTFSGHSSWVSSVSYSPDGKYFISGSGDKTIKLWEIESGKEIRTFSGHSSVVNSISYSPDGKYFISGSRDNTIKLWDIESGKEIRTFSGHSFGVFSVSYSPDGKYFISGSRDHTIKLWEIESGKEIRTFSGHSFEVNSLSYCPDGKYFISGSWDHTIKLWDIESGKEIRTFSGHSSEVSSLSYSPDGKYFISGSGDNTIKLWDVEKGVELASFISFNEPDSYLVYAPDGRFYGAPRAWKELYYVQGMKPITLDAFYEKFYTPGLMQKVMSSEIEPDQDRGEIFLPPSIELKSHSDGEILDNNLVRLMVELKDEGGGIDEIRLYQNEKLVEETKYGFQPGKIPYFFCTFDITLVPGVNFFKVVAFGTDRTESNIEFTLELNEEVSKQINVSSNLYVFAVGINKYENSSNDLNYGKPDAKAFTEVLNKKSRTIFKDVFVHEIYDSDAVKYKIDSVFKAIADSAKAADVFIFYYAGHGYLFDEDQPNSSDYYLILHDIIGISDEKTAKKKGISSDELVDYSKNIKAQKQLIVLDACHSGAAAEKFKFRGFSEEKAIKQLSRSAGVAVLAASGSEQASTEFDVLGHGVFTYAILKALDGESDNGDGKITVSELVNYVSDKVPELTERFRGKRQYPTKTTFGNDFPIAIVK